MHSFYCHRDQQVIQGRICPHDSYATHKRQIVVRITWLGRGMCKYGAVTSCFSRAALAKRTSGSAFASHASFTSRAGLFLAATATATVLVLAGCSSSSSSNVTSTNDNVQFTECTPEVCDTTVDGYPVKIEMPAVWNGTLMIFTQDYRGAEPIPPAKSVPEATPAVAPKGSQEGLIAEAMKKAGYAVAGAAVPNTGWQINEQVKAAQSVRDQFVGHIAQPNRIFTWGEGTGALASVQIGQTSDWANGSVGYCGLLAGFNKNYDLALDAAFAVKTLLAPDMKLTNYKNAAEAQDNYDLAMKAVKKAAKDKYGDGAMKLWAIASATVLPTATKISSGSSVSSAPEGIASNLRIVLARSTIDRYHLEQQFGGNPSSNVGTNYMARPTTKQVEKAQEVKKGALAKYVGKIQDAQRVSPDKEPRAQAAANGELSGKMKVPTVTLHTEFDPLAIVQNEGDLVAKTVEEGSDSRSLLSPNVISPPLFYTEAEPAAYGVGHCSFTDASIVGAVKVVNEWVRDNKFPTKASIEEALGEESGFSPNFPLYTWPGGAKD